MGVGDPFGMSVAHIMASCMGGMRTAGDLVAWMQLTRKMKIAELLDIRINSVELFKSQTGYPG